MKKIFLVIIIIALAFLFAIYTPSSILAGVGTCSVNNSNFVINGLVTTQDLTQGLNIISGSACVINTPSAIIRLTDSKTNLYSDPKNPYPSLKTFFYTNSKSPTTTVTKVADLPANASQSAVALSGTTDYLYHILGNFTVSSPITNSGNTQTAVVFVDGDLFINQNITYSLANKGLVFIVSGNINIDPSVTTINAVLISSGTICTYYSGGTCASTLTVVSAPLTINGSLISLNALSPIKFKRALNNNTTAAEIVTFQPKYLVILKDLLGFNMLIFNI